MNSCGNPQAQILGPDLQILGPDSQVGDFGWCVELVDGAPRSTFCGTLAARWSDDASDGPLRRWYSMDQVEHQGPRSI